MEEKDSEDGDKDDSLDAWTQLHRVTELWKHGILALE